MTNALDTNVVVRMLAEIGTPQYETAKALFARRFTITVSVFMETEWVLRSVYHWPRERIAMAFGDIMDLPNFVGPSLALGWIIDRFAKGADFADMVHLHAADDADAFATFDQQLARLAGANSPIPIETLHG